MFKNIVVSIILFCYFMCKAYYQFIKHTKKENISNHTVFICGEYKMSMRRETDRNKKREKEG